MKKLNESERLERGVQILLSAQDKADLEKMARASGRSLSAATRPLVLRAIERWRKENPELAAQPLPEKPKTMLLDGKAVRTQRSLEAQLKVAAKDSSQNTTNGNGNGKANQTAQASAAPASMAKSPASKRAVRGGKAASGK